MLSIDFHAGQIQGFFNLPVDHLFASKVLLPLLEKMFSNLVIVSPDAGGVERARAYARRLNADLAIVDKRRDTPNKLEKGKTRIIGDVSGSNAFIIDDIVDTMGTLNNTVEALLEKGALSVSAGCIHPVLSGPALKNLTESKIEKLIVTDTIPLSVEFAASSKITVVSVANLLAQAIEKIHNDESVSSLFI
jgi:ribose-phosphate pyrophosphokinase